MKEVKDRIVQFANRYQLINAETQEVLGTYDFNEVTGTVQEAGTEINAELFQSINADIVAEANARSAADIVLQNNINAEAKARAEAINAEAQTRMAVDTVLQGNIDAEAEERENAVNAVDNKADAHIANKNNPHSVTKSQVGLGSVANERQYSAQNPPPYPVTSVAGKTGAVTLAKGDVGLGNVDNTSDANKPVSNAVKAELDKIKNGTTVVGQAKRLSNTTAVGSSAKPVYFNADGVPVACGDELDVSVTGGAGHLPNIKILRGTSNAGWYKIGSVDINDIGTGNTSLSVILFINGVYPDQTTGSNAGLSGEIEVDFRTLAGASGFDYARISISSGNLSEENICVTYSGTVAYLYYNLDADYESIQVIKNGECSNNSVANAKLPIFNFENTYYGTTAPSGAVYAVNRNNASHADTADKASDSDELGGVAASEYARKSQIPTVADPMYYYTAYPYVHIFQGSSSSNDRHVMLNIMSARKFNFLLTSKTTLDNALMLHNSLANVNATKMFTKDLYSFQGFIHSFKHYSTLGITQYQFKAEGVVTYTDGTTEYIKVETSDQNATVAPYVADIGGEMNYIESYGGIDDNVKSGYLMGYGSVDATRPSW